MSKYFCGQVNCCWFSIKGGTAMWMREICLLFVSTTTSHATTSPTVLTPRSQILTRTVTKGWDECVYFSFETNVQQFSVRTETSPAAVDLHSDYCRRCDVCRGWGQHMPPQIVFPTKLFCMNWDLLRLCPLLFTRSCSPPTDEKGVGRKLLHLMT